MERSASAAAFGQDFNTDRMVSDPNPWDLANNVGGDNVFLAETLVQIAAKRKAESSAWHWVVGALINRKSTPNLFDRPRHSRQPKVRTSV